MENKNVKHTPGPLIADKYGAHTAGNEIEISVRVGEDKPDYPEQERIGRICAAAPDLLAALEIAADTFEVNKMFGSWEICRAAIAKAKGE